jgi:hypothetical protein
MPARLRQSSASSFVQSAGNSTLVPSVRMRGIFPRRSKEKIFR